MNQTRLAVGAGGLVLGGLLIFLGVQNVAVPALAGSPFIAGNGSGVLFWGGVAIAAIALGGWELILLPVRFSVLTSFARYGRAGARIGAEMDTFLFGAGGDNFQVDDDYFETIGKDRVHPKYRTRREHKTLDDVPDYKQEIELPDHRERAENYPEPGSQPESPVRDGGVFSED